MSNINLNIDLNFQQLVEAVKQLSLEEKLILNDALWDEKMEIPSGHQALVLERINKAKSNPARLMDWEQVSKTLKG